MDKTTKTIVKRKRDKRHNKRWADNEIKQLLQYLKEQPEFEKPTAQIFYRKFLETCNLDASWSICRWKIKNLKVNYRKAENWRRSNGFVETQPNIKETLNKMCRFYDDLHQVFGNTFENICYETLDSNSMANYNRNYANESAMEESMDEYCLSAIKTEENVNDASLLEPLHSDTNSAELSIPLETDDEERNLNCKESLQKEYPAKLSKARDVRASNHVGEGQSERSLFLKMKFDFEKEKFRKEFELKEKKFAEEIKERKENFELKKLQLEKDERLRILELEKQERIERFEIEMKYGCGKKLRKMCRFYEDLHCLFGTKLQIFTNETFDVNASSNINVKPSFPLETAMDEKIEEYFITAIKSEENEDHSTIIVPEHVVTTSPESSFPADISADERNCNQTELMEQDFITHLTKTDQNNYTDHFSLNESDKSSFLKMKFEFEKEKFRKEFELKEKRFAEEVKERKENFELKRLEMEKEERLRIMELEKQERIERFEIEMRYRCKEK
ncbi:eukaryotic translation initiation factor 3 subunit A-like [Lucilia sericata]|uniref:eukaryotic translation initiation factor 3 subunit A-like n=1 Tax=Lucilia sericata TaxID=13632 RepID=UPI0018A836FC|nr:eukaryotic translation initiation factor 3 subunit A-like [Lucilia sericata]